MTSFASSNPLTGLPYPRTGKRGVPQQFPRRLYEMLESEARLSQTDPNHKDIISWSDSGNAFRILNVSGFSSHVLPKYFRTSKFSSFQRNLNLYGFSKVRRGADTDMYAHPSFVRGQPESLAQLRKCNSFFTRKKLAEESDTVGLRNPSPRKIVVPAVSPTVVGLSRAVSPSPPRAAKKYSACTTVTFINSGKTPPTLYLPSFWLKLPSQMSSPQDSSLSPKSQTSSSSDSGRLDLLALAMTSLAERDAKLAKDISAQNV